MRARQIVDKSLDDFNARFDNGAGGDIEFKFNDCDCDNRVFWIFVTCRGMRARSRRRNTSDRYESPHYSYAALASKAKDEFRRALIKLGDASRYNVEWDVLERPRKGVDGMYDRNYWHLKVSFYGGPDGVTISELLDRK